MTAKNIKKGIKEKAFGIGENWKTDFDQSEQFLWVSGGKA